MIHTAIQNTNTAAEYSVLSKPGPRAWSSGPLPSLRNAVTQVGWLAPGVGHGPAGWHGAGPVEAEKDPGEQGVQVEAPAGQRSTRQPLNSTAPLHG